MRCVSIAGLVIALAAASAAAEPTLTIQELVETAQKGNLDVQKARRTLVEAEKEVHWKSELESSSLSLKGTYGITDVSASSTQSEGEMAGTASLKVPIIPQVSLSLDASSTGDASASVALEPFAASRTLYAQKAAYSTAEADLRYKIAEVKAEVESAALAVLGAMAKVQVSDASASLAEKVWDMSQKAYELGELSYDDLEDARTDLISARKSALDAARSLLDTRVALYRLLGPEAGQPVVASIEVDDLLGLIASRDEEVKGKDAARAASLALREKEISLDSLRGELKATPMYRPDLSVGGGVSYKQSTGVLSGSGSVTWSFSPSDIKTDEREEVQQSIDETVRAIELERMALGLEVSILDQALSVSRQALETSQTEVKQVQAALVEAEVLFGQGERTELELEQARISVQSAHVNLFSAASAVLEAQANILLSYVL